MGTAAEAPVTDTAAGCPSVGSSGAGSSTVAEACAALAEAGLCGGSGFANTAASLPVVAEAGSSDAACFGCNPAGGYACARWTAGVAKAHGGFVVPPGAEAGAEAVAGAEGDGGVAVAGAEAVGGATVAGGDAGGRSSPESSCTCAGG